MPLSVRPHPDPFKSSKPSRLADTLGGPGAGPDDPLLQFQPQTPATAVAADFGLRDQGRHESRTDPQPRRRAATRAIAPLTRPTSRDESPIEGVMSLEEALSRLRPSRRFVWPATFIGGSAIGALVMWLFSGTTVPDVLNPPRVSAETTVAKAVQLDVPAAPPTVEPPPVSEPPVPTVSTERPAPPPISTAAASTTGSNARAIDARRGRDLREDINRPVGRTEVDRPAPRTDVNRSAPRSEGTRSAPRSEVARPAARAEAAPPGPVAAPVPQASPLAGFLGSIAVQSEPSGARVFVNGQSVGSTPMVLTDLPIGSRAIRVEAPGYQRWSAAVRVVANQQLKINAVLDHAP